MDYGRFPIDLYRVWQPETRSYVHGLTGSLRDVRMRFHDWICNEFCDGYSPRPQSACETDEEQDRNYNVTRKYRAARRRFRIVRVQVSIGDDLMSRPGNLTAAVV